VKLIKSERDIAVWRRSPTYLYLMNFIRKANDSIKGLQVSSTILLSPCVQKAMDLLQTLSNWVDEIPPIQQPMRYGNKAYRSWHTKVLENIDPLMRDFLPTETKDAAIELSDYLTESIGNITRIDYGTGHETAFVLWMCCLEKLGLVGHQDYPALVLRLFSRYLELMRKVQSTYLLEPAGSHGVWSLDDYHFLPFLWGSGQLSGQDIPGPTAVTNQAEVMELSSDYLYFSAVQFIYKMKTGPFAEHSPILYDISGLPSWEKANLGLFKMYEVEVLGKFPIVQHVIFGSLLTFE